MADFSLRDAFNAVLASRIGTSGLFSVFDGWKQTDAEIAAGVTPVAYQYVPGERARYASLADCIAVSATHTAQIRVSESISAVITIPSGSHIQGWNRPLITCTTNGVGALAGVSLAGFTMDGVLFKGSSDSTVPGVGYGGFSAANTGLVTIALSDSVKITNCGADTFYNGIVTMRCTNSFVKYNEITTFKNIGILFSQCQYSKFDFNRVHDCTQAGGVVCYGMTGTGDAAGGNTQKDCTANFNEIYNIPAWAGIMSHDFDGLELIGNKIRNVRKGLDIGHLVSGNICVGLTLGLNEIELTTTDTWGGASADHGGIEVVGFDATHQVDGVTWGPNAVTKYGNAAGMIAGGIPGPFVLAYAKNVTVSGGRATGTGTQISSPGFLLNGQLDNVAIGGLVLQGTMAQGAVRLLNVTGTQISVAAASTTQTTTTDNVMTITGSTVTNMSADLGAHNSTVPFSEATSTITWSGKSPRNSLLSTITYSASMTPDASLGDSQVFTATNNTAFTINAPINRITGQIFTLTMRNVSGGALGAATWNAVFKMSAWTNPANGQSRSIAFRDDGTNYIQVYQTGVDVPN